jgi:hypothetical protein
VQGCFTPGGVADPGSNGIMVRTSASTSTPRSITNADGYLTITDGDGVAGDIAIDTAATVVKSDALNTFSGALTGIALQAASLGIPTGTTCTVSSSGRVCLDTNGISGYAGTILQANSGGFNRYAPLVASFGSAGSSRLWGLDASDASQFVNTTGSGNVLRATSPTGVTLDSEDSGNSIGVAVKSWYPAAGCNGVTPSPLLDLPASNAPAAACVTTGNTRGVLDFNDTTDQSAQVTLMLPSDWNSSGAIDVRFKWFAAATSGNVIWTAAVVCVADNELDNPAFETAGTVTDTANVTEALRLNDATIAGLTKATCAAGELMHLKITRDADTDTMSGNARLVGIELTYRRGL